MPSPRSRAAGGAADARLRGGVAALAQELVPGTVAFPDRFQQLHREAGHPQHRLPRASG
jgi:hypothetical protein